MFGFGWAIYVAIIHRVVGRDMFTSLLATFGLALLIAQALNLIFGPEVRTAEAGLGTFFLADGIIAVQWVRLISLGLAAGLAVGLVLFMRRSRMGRAIRATAQDARAARVLGVETDRVYADRKSDVEGQRVSVSLEIGG